MKTVTLNETNAKMPMVGLGTWQAKPDEIANAVNIALDSGYRLIDTAFNYNNEDVIGQVLTSWLDQKKGERSELFITTKLPHIANRAQDVEKFLKISLMKLKLSYVDLYLIHVPFGFENDEKTMSPKVKENGDFELDLTTDHISLWKAMEAVKELGLAKNIGLSNFNEDQIEAIYSVASVKPQVLQVECHVYLQQAGLREYCQKKNIVLTAYSPLGSPGSQHHFASKYNYGLQNCPDLIGHPIVKAIAAKHEITPSQVMLKYLTTHNIVVIPKSSNPERLKKNIDLFSYELGAEDTEALKLLDRGEGGRIIDFLFWKGVQNHPKYPFLIKA